MSQFYLKGYLRSLYMTGNFTDMSSHLILKLRVIDKCRVKQETVTEPPHLPVFPIV